jgi:large subunit ribosomal protein L18
MNRLAHKQHTGQRRAARVRATVTGTTERPRLAVKVSNLHVTAQLIDDSQAKTLAYSTSVGRKMPGNMTEKAVWAGTDIAQKAKKAKIKQVVFDRSSRKYHGRIKALADAARKEGLEF